MGAKWLEFHAKIAIFWLDFFWGECGGGRGGGQDEGRGGRGLQGQDQRPDAAVEVTGETHCLPLPLAPKIRKKMKEGMRKKK